MGRPLITASKLDRDVKILRRLPAGDDGYAKQPGAWALLAERSASVKPILGREPIEAGGHTPRSVMSFWLRYDEVTCTVTSLDALEMDGVRYEIVAPPMEVGRREGIEIRAVAGEAALPLATGQP